MRRPHLSDVVGNLVEFFSLEEISKLVESGESLAWRDEEKSSLLHSLSDGCHFRVDLETIGVEVLVVA